MLIHQHQQNIDVVFVGSGLGTPAMCVDMKVIVPRSPSFHS